MDYSFNLPSDDLGPVLAIGLTTVCFLITWFVGFSPKLKASLIAQFGEEKGKARQIVFHKLLGVLFLGIVPTIAFFILVPNAFNYLGLGFQNTSLSLLYIGGLMCLLSPLMIHSSKQKEGQAMYPPLRLQIWTPKYLVFDALVWALYLFAYEILFRGLLLFSCVEAWGVYPAIVINIALYACTHIPKGGQESFGAIPLGILFCLMTLHTGTIWAAFVIHFLMAFVNDLLHIYQNDEMGFAWQKQKTPQKI